jgi:hypothetical protein
LRTALAVGPANQGTRHADMRIAQAAQQRTGAAEPEPDPEPAARLEPGEDLLVPRIRILFEQAQVFSSSS